MLDVRNFTGDWRGRPVPNTRILLDDSRSDALFRHTKKAIEAVAGERVSNVVAVCIMCRAFLRDPQGNFEVALAGPAADEASTAVASGRDSK